MESFLRLFADRSRVVLFLLIILIVFGYISYSRMPKESNPDIKIPIIYVNMHYEGISPEDGENLLIKPIENAFRGIVGVKEIKSYANEGNASVVLEFEAGIDPEKALSDVRSKVSDTEYKLPKGMNKPTVHEINLSLEPVLSVILSGNISRDELIPIARKLRDIIEGVEGVLEAKIAGNQDDVIEIIIEPSKLSYYGLSLNEIERVISANNILISAGKLRKANGEYAIKIPSLINNIKELLEFPIKKESDAIIKLQDIANVRRTYKDPENITRVNGVSAIVLEVSKRTGTNIISTVAAIKKTLEGEKNSFDSNLRIAYAYDESSNIKDMVLDLENNIIIASILVMVVVVLSVGVRSALLIALSIPFSFLAGIILLEAMGCTLNVVVLFSLILTIGMIVDDAIVVSEYADRKMIEGEKANIAFIMAASRMFWPIVTATLVKIIAFMPLLFWPGTVGQFMKYMPITVIAILTNSLLFALLLQPSIGAILGKPNIKDQKIIKNMIAAENGDIEDLNGITKMYYSLLVKVLKYPKLFVLSILVGLVFAYLTFFMFGPGIEFFPKIDPTKATLVIESPGNLSLTQKDDLLKKVEARILNCENEVKVFYAKSGVFRDDMVSLPQDTIATISLELIDWKMRRKANLIFDDILNEIQDIDGIKCQILEKRSGPPSLKPIEINFTSKDLTKLNSFVDRFLKDAMVNDFKDIEDSRPSTAMEWHIVVDRVMAAKHLLSISAVGQMVQLVTTGFKVSKYRSDDSNEEVDVILRFPIEKRNLTELDNLRIVNSEGDIVPISRFVKKVAMPKIDQIIRVDRERVVTIKSNVENGIVVDNKVKELKEWLEKNSEDDVTFKFKGDEESQNESSQFLMSAFILALLIMFGVMLIQFNKFYQTLIVMSAVFLSTVGVLLGLLIFWQPFGIVMCGVGIIALSGIVLNNNILFVDTYKVLLSQNHDVLKAIAMTGIQRLRPILLTAVTAVLGLLPMVFGLTIDFFNLEITYDSPASQWWRQLATAIAGGLSFATILTLFFTPCLLFLCRGFEKNNGNC